MGYPENSCVLRAGAMASETSSAAVKFGELPKKSSRLQSDPLQSYAGPTQDRRSREASLHRRIKYRIAGEIRDAVQRAPAQGRVYNHCWAFPKCRLLKLKARRYAHAKEHRGSADATRTRPSMVFRLVLYLLTCQCEWYYQP